MLGSATLTTNDGGLGVSEQLRRPAESDADVRITREDMVVTGRGFAWNGRDETFEIFKEAKVVLKGGRKQMAAGATE